MQLRNSSARYGWVSIVLHWGVALVVFSLFALGLWMVGLDYYSAWRKDAPDLHKSIGITLFAIMLVRIVWRLVSPPPPPLASYSRLTRIGAAFGHAFLYLGLFAVMIAGYLISTADGVGIPVFGLFEIPAVVSGLPTRQTLRAWCTCTSLGCWWSLPACTAWLR